MYRVGIKSEGVALPRSFYERDPVNVARELIGKVLWRRHEGTLIGGIILETEAYLAEADPASHSCRGLSKKNRSMFGEAGRLYVYSIHAKYCLNAVTEEVGRGSAVLIRALEPIAGMELMASQRGTKALRDLCRGPARLCQALGVSRAQDGIDLTVTEEVWVADVGIECQAKIVSGVRIGISEGCELPLRFFVNRHPLVSGRARDHSERPLKAFRLWEAIAE